MDGRWLELQGATNVRDLGDLPTVSGGLTRPGVLIRSDAVHQLTADDVAHLVDQVGLRHVIDLRADGERRDQTRGLLGGSGVAYSELSVLTDDMIAERRHQRELALAAGEVAMATVIGDGYVDLLDCGRAAFATALERVVEPGGAPALIHCTAGKDRTGVLVALLLEAAGVERSAIVADYAATGERMELVRQRLAAMPAYAQMAAEAPGGLLGAEAATMERFLDRLKAEHGGAVAWFTAAGVAPAAVEAWRARLVG